jgi:fumarate hydratase subunit beta
MRTARHVQIPMDEKTVRKLKTGERLLLSGRIITGRDMAHQWLAEEEVSTLKALLKDAAIYHCGPIMHGSDKRWSCISAGPTSSVRQEPFMPSLIRDYGLRCIIGKGGMGEATAEALRTYGAVYCSAVGGAAVLYANCVQSVERVIRLDDFGMPEALWLLNIRDFPVMITMDAEGNSLHRDIEKRSREKWGQMLLGAD